MMLACPEPPRAVLQRLIDERKEDYAGLSRLIGRNAAYIQQFIKRGTPKRLAEEDRRTLARYFGVAEAVLGAPDDDPAARRTLIPIPRLNVRASAGPGAAFAGEEVRSGIVGFDERWLRKLAGGSPDGLSMIRVEGDSMMPTLADGDEIIVNRSDALDRLRDGIYVLRVDDLLMVKRVAVAPSGRKVSVRSDNPAYPAWPDCDLRSLTIIGRVVWGSRRFG